MWLHTTIKIKKNKIESPHAVLPQNCCGGNGSGDKTISHLAITIAKESGGLTRVPFLGLHITNNQ